MKAAEQTEQEAADWLAARDSERWDADQQRSLDAWLAESTLHRVAFLRLEQVWKRADRLHALRRAPAPPAVGRASLGFSPRRAALGLALAAGIVILVGDGTPFSDVRMFETPIGQRQTVALADGSTIHLNTNTRLRTRMAAQERSVWLDQGEAYFEVAHDPARPFTVDAGSARVRVLGTRFTLRRDGQRVKVVVKDGRVQIQSKDMGVAELTRTQVASVERDEVELTQRSDKEIAASLSWLQGKLTFDNTTLAEAAAQFNRYNQRQLLIEDEQAAEMRIGGAFEADKVDTFVRLLDVAFGLEVRQVDGNWRVGGAKPAAK